MSKQKAFPVRERPFFISCPVLKYVDNKRTYFMKRKGKQPVRRSQRDYTLGFKLSVVAQVEKGDMTYKQAQTTYGIQGRSTVLTWLRKHGSLDWSKPVVHSKIMPKAKETPAQKIKRLEKELQNEKMKTMLLNEMIDISDREFGTAIRKKLTPELHEIFNKKS